MFGGATHPKCMLKYTTQAFLKHLNTELVYFWNCNCTVLFFFRVGQLVVTKALGVLSDDTEEDFERITHHYKDLERKTDRQEVLKESQVQLLVKFSLVITMRSFVFEVFL